MRLRRRSPLLASAVIMLAGSLATPTTQAADAQQTGWAAWFNSYRFNDRLGLISDLQLRSRDEWAGPRNLLIRPGLSWFMAPGQSLTLGYAYIGTYNADAPDAIEHRIWQQYLSTYRIERLRVSQRLRLEERFIGRPNATDVQSLRLRWFSRLVLPIDGGSDWVRGPFVAVQNEAFVNLSNRDDLNGQFFDQNRAYVAFGWRLNAHADIEIGYLNQYLNGRRRDTVNHVLQVALYTNFRR